MSVRLLTRIAMAAAAVSSSVVLASSLELVNPAVRAMPPTASATGAYVMLHNNSETPRALVAVESDAAKMVEIHISEMKGNTMSMHQVDEIPVPANGHAVLKPGGYHIMLMGLKKPLKAGDEVDFTLVMKNGERISMTAPVKSPEDMAAYAKDSASMGHMNHGEMTHNEMEMHGDKHHDH